MNQIFKAPINIICLEQKAGIQDFWNFFDYIKIVLNICKTFLYIIYISINNPKS